MSESWPPGPRGHWWAGNRAEFAGRRLEFMTDCARTYGDVSCFRIGSRRIVLVNDPALIEQVLVTDARHYVKHFGLRMYHRLFGSGVVLAEGAAWLGQRRLMQPAFLRKRVAAYAPAMVGLAQRATGAWRPSGTLNLAAEMMHLTGAVTLKVLFGTDDPGEQAAFDAAQLEVLHRVQAGLRRPLPVPEWVPTPGNVRLRRAIRKMDAILDRLTAVRPAEPRDDLVSCLLQVAEDEPSRMPARLLRDELMTLFIAGRETTALALSWAWYLLATHPAAERQLVEEWRSVLGGRPPRYEDLDRLEYTGHVVSEALRLYPPVVLLGREATGEVELGGYRLSAGTTVFMSQWVTHRDPRFFENPDVFLPERWGGGLVERLPKFAYYPFGGGPRVCIGNAFALMEAVLVLATIGQRWRFTLAPDAKVEPWPAMTLRPRYGLPVVVQTR